MAQERHTLLSVLEAASPASGCQPLPCLVKTTADGQLLIVHSRDPPIPLTRAAPTT